MCDDDQGKGDLVGAPMWVVTFGDLMSLLLCFFVLLLSFSETDRQKYKELSGSMADAFGVQKEERVFNRPQGNNIVATDFDKALATKAKKELGIERSLKQQEREGDAEKSKTEKQDEIKSQTEKLDEESKASKEYAKYVLEEEIEKNLEGLEDKIEVKMENGQLIIRLMGETTFNSGKSRIKSQMIPLLKKMGSTLKKMDDDIIISGHTDNVPIRRGAYDTNLELSVARAYSVADFFIHKSDIDPRRIATMGFGEYRPIKSNNTSKGREKNRRVEIILSDFDLPGS